jgi:hypothetical protein
MRFDHLLWTNHLCRTWVCPWQYFIKLLGPKRYGPLYGKWNPGSEPVWAGTFSSGHISCAEVQAFCAGPISRVNSGVLRAPRARPRAVQEYRTFAVSGNGERCVMEGKWRRLKAVGPCQRSREMQDNSVKSLFFLELEILVDVIGSESRNPRCDAHGRQLAFWFWARN